MRTRLVFLCAVISILLVVGFVSIAGESTISGNFSKAHQQRFLEGDIIFQGTDSEQCRAIKKATHSKFTHVGIIIMEHGALYVLEAVEPVQITPLKNWIERGDKGYYTLMRMKDRETYLVPEKIAKARQLGEEMKGKQYDLYFNWSDDQLYCSELVWKLYKKAFDLELCPLKKLKDFDLSSPEVRAIMEKRYGKNPPLEEQVVAPSDIAASRLLYVVEKNNLR
jgi:hypothetical protein